jgi:hypothetical protein
MPARSDNAKVGGTPLFFLKKKAGKLQLVLKTKLKPQKEIHDILTKLQEIYDSDSYSKNPTEYIKYLISRSPDTSPFLTDELITLDFTWEDVEANKTSIDITIRSVVEETRKIVIQLYLSTGTINIYYDDPIGQLIGLDLVSILCEDKYHFIKAIETPNELKKINDELRNIVRLLTIQRQKAIKTIAELLIQRDKIQENEALKQAMQLIGIPILPIKDSEELEQTKNEFKKAFKESRKTKREN